MAMTTYDYIVVGSGSGGGAVAGRLSDVANVTGFLVGQPNAAQSLKRHSQHPLRLGEFPAGKQVEEPAKDDRRHLAGELLIND